jgi:hypothetical protein
MRGLVTFFSYAGKQIVVLCENGGSLENKSGTKYGFQSR